MSLLEIDGIHTYYGQSHVLQDVSLSVDRDEVVALLGRNGAGKTTTLKSIVGLTPPRRGTIRFNGSSLAGNEPYEISRSGIGYVPEERDIFPELAVEDNLLVALDENTRWTLEDVYELFPRLRERADQKGHSLSGGEQQMLAIARALVTNPNLLLLDEPSEGLAPNIIDNLKEMIADIQTDVTILLTEQNTEFIFDLADRGYILEKGQVKWDGSIEELRENERILEKYLALSGENEEVK